MVSSLKAPEISDMAAAPSDHFVEGTSSENVVEEEIVPWTGNFLRAGIDISNLLAQSCPMGSLSGGCPLRTFNRTLGAPGSGNVTRM